MAINTPQDICLVFRRKKPLLIIWPSKKLYYSEVNGFEMK